MMWFAQLVGLSERWQFNPEAFFSLSLSLSLSLIFFFSPIVRELVLSLTRLSFPLASRPVARGGKWHNLIANTAKKVTQT